ncbi:MAG: acyltransferase domain-containing protein [Propionibacteriaceae bacterium]|nr:acyltransferase domain-containing protein [Propionibacteriaceae bacterium]
MSVLDALARADLHRLGFREADARDVAGLIDALPSDPARLARVEALATRFRSQVGDFFRTDLGVSEDNDLAALEEGLVTMLALVAVAEDVHAEMVRRGVPDDVAWASLADLGQQAHIFRQVFGFFGLLARGWCASNYTGRLLWLGRLQYTLERDDEGTFMGVHIPESGPLTPDAVDESLAWARRLAPTVFAEYDVERFMIYSWLLDPGVAGLLNPESNFARFAQRFELTGAGRDGWRDALFYGFRSEPALQPVDLSALPADTSLRRALLRQIDGPGVRTLGGRLRR